MREFDFITCGECQTEFPLHHIVFFMQHKKLNCRDTLVSMSDYGAFPQYTCFSCPQKFGAAVTLLLHAQYKHNNRIFVETTVDKLDSAAERGLLTEIESSLEEMRPLAESDTTEVLPALRKCCSSIVPKKRKRHIETKHSITKHKGQGSRAKLTRAAQHVSTSSDIYIDLNQSSNDGECNSHNSMELSDRQSLLLKPGSTYTIPLRDSVRGSRPFFGISYTSSDSEPRDIVKELPSSRQEADTSSTALSVPCKMADSSVSHRVSSTLNQLKAPSTEEMIAPDNPRNLKRKYPKSKPFKCEYCDNSFNQNIHLKKHLSKHTGVKPYKCGQCDYATVERSHLKVHIRIHTGEKPFKCDHCEYATAQNSTLKIHLKRHHGGVLLECSQCGKNFPERNLLIEHKQEHIQNNDIPALPCESGVTNSDIKTLPAESSYETRSHIQDNSKHPGINHQIS